MKFSNIKIGHIYNVIFDPVEHCEFDGKHLALVFKKNNDGKTSIVMPLTTSSNGVGINKVKLDTIDSLPKSLKTNITYAVFNQVRTVSASRFIALKEGDNIIECPIGDNVFSDLLILAIRELTHDLEQDNKVALLKHSYEIESIIKAKDLAYNIISLQKDISENEQKIASMQQDIRGIIKDIPYTSYKHYFSDDVENIFIGTLNL